MGDSWITLEKGLPKLMDGGDPNSNAYVLWLPPAGLYTTFYELELGWAQAQNRTGGSVAIGVGARIAKPYWQAGQWVNATTTYTDDTPDAQSVTANDFPLETLVANDGFIVASDFVFNAIDLNVTTASVAGTPAHDVSYSGPAGWVVLSNLLSAPPAAYTVAETLIFFNQPPDWTKMTVALHGTGVPVGRFGIRVRATTPPTTTAALAGSMTIAQSLGSIAALGTNTIYSSPFGKGGHVFNCLADALVGIITVANIQNIFMVNTRSR